jgi:hypothetical protein
MDCPRTPKELRRFIGCVNYYRDMWPSRAHVLKPLTDQAGLKKGEKLNWTPTMRTAFDKMHLLLAADALAAYPDHNKCFDIYTDSSSYQLGACIVQRVVLLLTSVKNWVMHREIISQWKKRCFTTTQFGIVLSVTSTSLTLTLQKRIRWELTGLTQLIVYMSLAHWL